MPPRKSPFNVLPVRGRDPEPLPDPIVVELEPEDTGARTVMEEGASKTELRDGSALIDLNPAPKAGARSGKFDANLADEIDPAELGRICTEVLDGIERDNQSRQEWLSTHAEGIKLLGLVLETERGDTGASSAPLEGMSTVRHPLLLEATLLFQANARGELLPAAGPVKVRDDRPHKPVGIGHNGGPPLDGAAPMPAVPPAPFMPMAGGAQAPVPSAPPPVQANGAMPVNGMPAAAMPQPAPQESRDGLAEALEKDFNHYLTTTAQEYYPDTDRMLFSVGFGGQGVKKVYNCPIRRRPVSESIPIEDFIVSDALTDLGNASRVTHQIRMRPSTLKRMQLLGVYRPVQIGTPTQSEQPNAVDQAKASVAGVQPQVADPRDADHVIYECYCELDIAGLEHRDKNGNVTGLRLPYRVTIEKDAQQVLEIRRNYEEDDPLCMPREYFVEFPFDKAFGFYGIGLLHILGNTTKALTSVWREFIDSGMFANFPGFVYAKGAGRQLTNQFRVPPGGGIGLDVGLQRLQDAVMPLPYKDLGPAFTAFVQHVEETGQRLGGAAQINVGEGKQDAPVGTTLALIEQATKPISAVLKRLHSAQAKEFQLLKERFKEDPESFWRFNKRPAAQWQKEQFVKALNDYDLVPVSDPNNPTALHRAAKATALQQMAMAAPGLIDPRKTFLRVAETLDIDDAEDVLLPPQAPQAPQPDPGKVLDAQSREQAAKVKAAGDLTKAQTDLATTKLEMEDRIAERAARERIAMIEQDTERLRLASTLAIHSDKTEAAEKALTMKIASDHVSNLATIQSRQRPVIPGEDQT